MTVDNLRLLGQILDAEVQGRDAVHIAIVPAIATMRLAPSEPVGLSGPGLENVSNDAKVLIGIVDPFLKVPVFQGERFWLWLYPNTITSLRHEWTHPAFEADDLARHRSATVEASKRWVKDFAAGVGLTYEDVISGANNWLANYDNRYGGYSYICRGGLLQGASVPDAFWDHYERIVDEKVEDDRRGSFFTCSC